MWPVKDHKGFTLVEIIITIVVVSFALFAMFRSVNFVTRKQLNAEMVTTSTFLAQEKMEEKIAQKRGSGYSLLLPMGTSSEVLSGTYANYTRSWEICYVNSSFVDTSGNCTAPDTGYKRIVVEVNYTKSLLGLPTDNLVILTTVVSNY